MFVRAPNPIWYLPDLIGQPLNDEYYAFFLTNTLPYLPQNVYRDPQGLTVWTGDVVEFYPNGTLPDNLYFDPNLVYRIEIRHGNSQADPLIYEINNFIPGGGSTPTNNSLAILGTDNEATNSTFAEVYFQPTITSTQPTETITTAGTYLIAPGWELVLTGTGTTTLTQLVLSGDQNQINNPPFALRVNNNGWTTSFLRQRFNHNGAIWANGAITMSITARAQTVAETVSLIYQPNSPGVAQLVATGLLGTGVYQVLQGAIDLPASVNNALSTVAFVDFIIQLPPTGIVDVSSVQIIGQSDPLPTNFNPLTDIPTYQQQSEERMIDHLFHIYRHSLLKEPKDNLLVGWTFALNPFQFNTTTLNTVSPPVAYVTDQTIIYTEADSVMQVGQADVTQRRGYQVQPIAGQTATRFALIQYIDPSTIKAYWSYILSCLVRARIFTTHGTQVPMKMRLIYRASLPPALSTTEPIFSWAADADPVFAAGWTAIAPLNDEAYILQNNYTSANNTYPELSFDKFQLPDDTNDNMTLGVVIYTMKPLNSTMGSLDYVVFDRVSLTQNEFAIDASPETFDETLRKCQFYFEKSYSIGTPAGTITNIGQKQSPTFISTNVGTNSKLYIQSFTCDFMQVKRGIPSTITFFSPTSATSNLASVQINSNASAVAQGNVVASTAWQLNPAVTSTERFQMLSLNTSTAQLTWTNAGAALGDEGIINYHYVADARLGV